MLKDLAKQLQRDYIPNGRRISRDEFSDLKFRRTEEYEIYQCGCQTGNDIQSGPIYCGRVADFLAETKEGVLAACKSHFRNLGLKVD